MSEAQKGYNTGRATALCVLGAGIAVLIFGLDHVKPIRINLMPLAIIPILFVKTVRIDADAVSAVTGLVRRTISWSRLTAILFEGPDSGGKPTRTIVLKSADDRDVVIKTALIAPHETRRLVETLRQEAEARGIACH